MFSFISKFSYFHAPYINFCTTKTRWYKLTIAGTMILRLTLISENDIFFHASFAFNFTLIKLFETRNSVSQAVNAAAAATQEMMLGSTAGVQAVHVIWGVWWGNGRYSTPFFGVVLSVRPTLFRTIELNIGGVLRNMDCMWRCQSDLRMTWVQQRSDAVAAAWAPVRADGKPKQRMDLQELVWNITNRIVDVSVGMTYTTKKRNHQRH